MAPSQQEGSTVEVRGRMMRRAFVPTAIFTALLIGVSAVPAQAGAGRPGWQSYLEQPKSSNVTPVSATVLSGNVSNAWGLTSHRGGATTLTATSGQPAVILLDYGEEVEGLPYLNVKSYSSGGTSPSVS